MEGVPETGFDETVADTDCDWVGESCILNVDDCIGDGSYDVWCTGVDVNWTDEGSGASRRFRLVPVGFSFF